MKKRAVGIILLMLCGTAAGDDIQVLFSSVPIPAAALARAGDARPLLSVEKVADCVDASTGRTLYDAWFSSAAVAKWARQRLLDAGYAPVLIAAHNFNADAALDDDNITELVPMTAARRNELLRCLPSICTAAGPWDAPVINCSRPTQPYEAHRYSGWMPRVIN